MDREIKELVCIICPLGCNLRAVVSGGQMRRLPETPARGALNMHGKSSRTPGGC